MSEGTEGKGALGEVKRACVKRADKELLCLACVPAHREVGSPGGGAGMTQGPETVGEGVCTSWALFMNVCLWLACVGGVCVCGMSVGVS